MSILDKIFGTYSEREVKKVSSIVDKIEELDIEMRTLSDSELKGKTSEFKERYSNGESLDDILIEAFAVVREASRRTTGLHHYREQLIGGVVLHQGRIAEMKTGEGKTLVGTLPAYLNAISGKGVHVVTVNDYLASRDATEMSVIYSFLGLTTGVILNGLNSEERRNAYSSDITYGTNNEYGFDYLRDNMSMDIKDNVQRTLNYCIVDEVDSILIDEARTPLIISGQGEKSTDFYKIADSFVKGLKEDIHFTIDKKGKTVILTEEGISRAERVFSLKNYADSENLAIQHYITQSLRANYYMILDKDYIVKNGEIIIVDEFTGRLMDGRRYSDGLHQAIEAKEDVEIKRESKTLATITFQNYFRMYSKLSGMTGTALTEESEFREIYNLDCISIPTHKPIRRIDHVDAIYITEKAKFNAVIEDITNTNDKGQPVLVGTTSIEKSEILSQLLKDKGIPHKVLNAKYHDIEAEIIADAGYVNNITIATNMAGRGTDIKLGEGAVEAGGLKIIGTERHESRRIDNQLRGRSGRQGDPGESKFYISLEDDLMKIFGSEKIASLVEKMGLNEDDVIENSMVANAIGNAQKKVEGNYFVARKNVLGYDDVMNQQRTIIYKERNWVLSGGDTKEHIQSMIEDVIDKAIILHLQSDKENITLDDAKSLVIYLEDCSIPRRAIRPSSLIGLNKDKLKEYILSRSVGIYKEKEALIGLEEMRDMERLILLRCVDRRWMNHIDDMDRLKQGMGLRAYKQEDPVQAYQMEGSELFHDMIDGIKMDTVKNLFNLSIEPLEILEGENEEGENEEDANG